MAVQKVGTNIIDSAYTTTITTNPEFSGTEAARMPSGTTEQRANAQAGDIRFNTTLSLMEYYDGTNWKSIDSPPVVTSASPSYFVSAGETITVNGANFQAGATVKLVGQNGVDYTADVVSIVNSSQLTFQSTSAMVSADSDPYDVVVTNSSGLSGTLADYLDWNPSPVWSTASGSLATIFDSQRSSYSSISVSASDPEGASITYSVTSGSLPTGMSLNSSTGAITGTPNAVGSDTTSSFTIAATDGVNTVSRSFSITVRAPIITSFTSIGSSTFSVPTGVSSLQVVVVGGGGGGCHRHGGGGGAGGFVEHSSFPVTPGGTVSYTVGAGGSGAGPGGNDSTNGSNSVFGSIIALGGGYGYSDAGPSGPGGSGGGGPGPAPSNYGNGIQGPSGGGTGYGNRGGNGTGPNAGGGGGGAGAVGGDATGGSVAGAGGAGRSTSISGSPVFYAGGGGGGFRGPGSGTSGRPGGSGGGGPGIIIIRY